MIFGLYLYAKMFSIFIYYYKTSNEQELKIKYKKIIINFIKLYKFIKIFLKEKHIIIT